VPTLLTDDLLRRIERTRAAYRFVRLRALQNADIEPEGGPFRIAEFGDVLATDWKPMPRIFCFDHTQLERLDEILAWFDEAGRAPHFELLPYEGNRAVFDALAARGFAPRYTISVLFTDASERRVDPRADVSIRRSPDEEIDRWIGVYIDAHGWECTPEERPTWITELRAQYLPSAISRYVAERRDEILAVAASYHARGDHAHLTNCATLPSHRGYGLHRALISERLADAQASGATITAADTTPQSGSQRNLERAGFRLAYQKTHWERRAP